MVLHDTHRYYHPPFPCHPLESEPMPARALTSPLKRRLGIALLLAATAVGSAGAFEAHGRQIKYIK